jgi:hypothetical protein
LAAILRGGRCIPRRFGELPLTHSSITRRRVKRSMGRNRLVERRAAFVNAFD